MVIQFPNSNSSVSTGFMSYGSSTAYIGIGVTLQDLLDCCEANGALLDVVIKKLNLRGFKRDKPTRKELREQGQKILNELRTLKGIIGRDSGGSNGIR